MARSVSDQRAQRPREEYLLFALMGVLIGAGFCFFGADFLLSADSGAPSDVISPVALQVVRQATPAAFVVVIATNTPTGIPTPTSTSIASPVGTSTPTPTATRVKIPPGAYRVQEGDTLLGIAYRAGLTLDDLLFANPKIINPNKLAISQLVIIPEGGRSPVGLPPQAITPVVVEINGGKITYPQVGAVGGYVPYGAMSVSAAHTVARKFYPAGSFEYLHGLFRVPFLLPYIAQSVVTLPPPVPSGTCPLTGLPLASNDIVRRRPLNVRIDNAPPARPQSGLGNSDIVFETLAEGGITRFTAVFLCSAASVDIGPIRSARLIDLQLAPMFKAILVHVGAAPPVLDMIWSSEIGEADFDPGFRNTFGFGRITSRVAPHNTYSSIGSLWAVASNQGLVGPVDLQGLSFSDAVPSGGTPATSVSVPYNVQTDVGYLYESGMYLKTISGVPHMDANSGRPLRFANVILMVAQATYTDALEDGIASRSLHFNVQGAGRAILLRDGQAFEVVWRREGRNILFHFTDAKGNHVPLKPGATMVNIVPLELGVSVQ